MTILRRHAFKSAGSCANWILNTGLWVDAGLWVDVCPWND